MLEKNITYFCVFQGYAGMRTEMRFLDSRQIHIFGQEVAAEFTIFFYHLVSFLDLGSETIDI